MKVYQIVLSLLALGTGLHAADPNPNELPSSAISCMQQLFPSSEWNSTAYLCADDSRQTALVDCVTSNGTTKEEFITQRLTEESCNIKPRQGPPLIEGSTLAPLILATFFFTIRISAKSFNLGGGWGWDDLTIIISYVMGVAMFVLNIYMIKYGFGKNIWDIPFDDITQFYKYFQGFAVMYKIQISLAKISVCLFLLRIFQSRMFRTLAYTLIGINASIGITWALVDGLRCSPVHLAWDGWANEDPGTCIDFIDAILGNCLVNIIVDAIMVLMPVYEVSKLQLPLYKKLTVGLMFVMGSVLTIIGIIRVVVFWNNRWGQNQTAGIYPLIHWSVIESQVAIICACLPSSRALLNHFFPGIFSGSTKRTYATGPSNWYAKGQSNGQSKINKSVSYTVQYSSSSQRDDSNDLNDSNDSNSVVQLVDIDRKPNY
ncbi:integral membrane protein [Aspergillus flavus]|uniref:Integral membrane protein n=2 Tax=Aspergillus subgen. Circumdati TaxID=2720871 RepID=A0A7U2R018_ASPFN|nr:uncharacterized protein G4B84_007301 [Aspergillus flavus NRRL3357]KOC10127.1 integral membrane protein [Aspergillus flavus AF70]OOO12163.1 hypothetical protein OAory_01086330 [Aspergillus oryzae]QRD90989.1 integral membrane protein [Aspergillus flavus]KAF7621160.1 hypothetical protein AFLA_011470 [Aspergillus flavus NRRL3357]QMW31920.1 hypothetical protein G4B84_007301 [Aspergillus flavus NRRL3357]